ncbi:MAG: S26 family signal peptidase [Bacteroidales bacterium]|nr:S26 family signal peptidase [Bacteroidales bacterium]
MAETKSKTTESTVTTTVTTTTVTTVSNDSGKSKMSGLVRALIIAASILLLCVAIGFIFFGRARINTNGMENTCAKNSTVFFSRFSTPGINDVVLFHHPEADTIVPSNPDLNYYKMRRKIGMAWCTDSELKPLNKKRRPIHPSRVIGLPGQVVAIKDGVICRAEGNNLVAVADAPTVKNVYIVGANSLFSSQVLDSLGLTKEGMNCEEINPEAIVGFYRHKTEPGTSLSVYALTAAQAQAVKELSFVNLVEKVVLPQEHFDPIVFPYTEQRHFNISYMTPMVIPAKGKVIKLDVNNLPFYRRCIEAYEGKSVEVDGNIIYIEGKETDSYRFGRDYYFVVSDNRATTDDSRFFGFLPDNHIVGVVK